MFVFARSLDFDDEERDTLNFYIFLGCLNLM